MMDIEDMGTLSASASAARTVCYLCKSVGALKVFHSEGKGEKKLLIITL